MRMGRGASTSGVFRTPPRVSIHAHILVILATCWRTACGDNSYLCNGDGCPTAQSNFCKPNSIWKIGSSVCIGNGFCTFEIHCNLCANGKYTESTDGYARECKDCPAGTVGGGAGSNCITCGAGTYISVDGQTTCEDCGMDTYQPAEGATACIACDLGYYSHISTKATLPCKQCLENHYYNKNPIYWIAVYNQWVHWYDQWANCVACAGTTDTARSVCCSKVQFAFGPKCFDHQFATLQIESNAITIKSYDRYPDNGVPAVIPRTYYLDFQSRSIEKGVCQPCRLYEYRSSCGPLHDISGSIQSIYVTITSTISAGTAISVKSTKAIAEWRVTGTPDAEIVKGFVERSGVCLPCRPCDVGYYMRECGLNGPGVCFTCRRNCLEAPGHHLAHVREEGCRNEYVVRANASTVAVYLASEDYKCIPCQLSRRTVFDTYELLVGCAGEDELVRWHPRAEAEGGGGRARLLPAKCVFGDDGRGDAASEACRYRGELLQRHPPVSFPGGQALRRQAFTSIMPYCPPGWRVDDACFSSNAEGAAWDAACCVRCAYCDPAQGLLHATTWRACSGAHTNDTQTCTRQCDIGEFMREGSCALCRTCV